ncbi:serine/threonine protein kinase [Patescibacteria group bacterium]|nr:serine/threonine protein kinase [Patescibacteria group bacterium]
MTTEERMQRLVGTVLKDTYRLEEIIGAGGMAVIFLAMVTSLARKVAVKVFPGSNMDDNFTRFKREAEITSRLAHPNIIMALDFGQTPSGMPYIVMEYLEGEDLEQRLLREIPQRDRNGRKTLLELEEVADIVKQVASGLAAAHSAGVVHRDLKPSNIFLCRHTGGDETVKVVDFGISMMKGLSRLTARDIVPGTPVYASPEQIRCQDLDQRTDIYSLGVTIYEMLTGRWPYGKWPQEGGSVLDVMRKIGEEMPAPMPEIHPAVEEVVLRALSKDRDKRHQTMDDFRRDFEVAVDHLAEQTLIRSNPLNGGAPGKKTLSWGASPATPGSSEIPTEPFSPPTTAAGEIITSEVPLHMAHQDTEPDPTQRHGVVPRPADAFATTDDNTPIVSKPDPPKSPHDHGTVWMVANLVRPKRRLVVLLGAIGLVFAVMAGWWYLFATPYKSKGGSQVAVAKAADAGAKAVIAQPTTPTKDGGVSDGEPTPADAKVNQPDQGTDQQAMPAPDLTPEPDARVVTPDSRQPSRRPIKRNRRRPKKDAGTPPEPVKSTYGNLRVGVKVGGQGKMEVTVLLDGKIVGKTPLFLPKVPTGVHQVGALYQSDTRTERVELQPGKTSTVILKF